MSQTARPHHGPEPVPARRAIIALGGFSAVSAIGGGIELLAWPRDNPMLPPGLLEGTVFESFLWPGVILVVLVGGSSLACTICAATRHRYTVDATVFAGGTLTVWIVAEVAQMGGVYWLHGLYGGLGLALLALGMRAAHAAAEPRHRWVIAVTAAEASGFVVPLTVGLWFAGAGPRPPLGAAILVVAGAVEGALLGAGEAWAMPVRVRKGRFVMLTAAAAGLVWALALATVRAASAPAVAPWVAWALTPVAALVGLGAIGMAQWLELRRRNRGAGIFARWTALAWAVAFPLSLWPSPLVDEGSPKAVVFTLFACAGVSMAYAMALVTWQGARRLRPKDAPD